MSYKEIKIQTKVLVVSICIVVLTIIGTSYAAFVWNDTGSNQTVSSGNYTIEIENTSGNSIALGNAYPMSDEEGKATTPYKFTIRNNSNTDVEFSLKLEDDPSKTNDMSRNNLKIYLTGDNKIDSVGLIGLPNRQIDAGILKANSSRSYELRLWIREDASNSTIGTSFNGMLTLDTTQIEQTGINYQKGDVNMNGVIDYQDVQIIGHIFAELVTVSEQQEELADITDDGVIDSGDTYEILVAFQNNSSDYLQYKTLFNTSTNGSPNFTVDSTDNGIFVQSKEGLRTKNGLPVYYYRGPVENNYVQFGTYTTDVQNTHYEGNILTYETVAHAGDPILWRIVRFNEDGTIKVITDNNVLPIIIWSDSSSSIYKNSNMETSLNNWYNETLLNNYDDIIATGEFCNDTSEGYLSAVERMGSSRGTSSIYPIFTCPVEPIKSKVGLLTADEAIYAGNLFNKSMNTYLGNTDYWTMTPLNSMWIAFSTNSYFTGYPSYWDQLGTRPVVNLKADVKVSGGTGTKTDPYIIN